MSETLEQAQWRHQEIQRHTGTTSRVLFYFCALGQCWHWTSQMGWRDREDTTYVPSADD